MIYLIDFENVHEDGFTAIEIVGEKDAVYCFFTKNVAKISMSALAGIRNGQLHFVEADAGKQSLDLALVSYLGYLIGTKPQELYYEIISNDNGFQKAADFWNKRGMNLRVRIRKTNAVEVRPKADTSRAQAMQAGNKAAATSVSGRTQSVSGSKVQPVSVGEKARPAATGTKTRQAEGSQNVQFQQDVLKAGRKEEGADVSALNPESAAFENQKQETGQSAAEKLVADISPMENASAPAKQKGTTRSRSRKRNAEQRKTADQKENGVENIVATGAVKPSKKGQEAVPAEEKADPVETPENRMPEMSTSSETVKKEQGKTSELEKAAVAQNEPEQTVKAQAEKKEDHTEKTPAVPAVSINPALTAALEAAGITGERAEFLQSQLDRYREEKNVKQLVYRALVKKYGQKSGTEIYNTAKKIQI